MRVGYSFLMTWTSLFNNATNSGFTSNSDLTKLMSKPANARAYYGHLQNLCTTVFNTTYLQPWAVHYNKFLSEDLTTYMSYVSTRSGANAINAVNTATFRR